MNVRVDKYKATLRDLRDNIRARGLLKMSEADAKRLLTLNSKGQSLHNTNSYSEAAVKRNGGNWPDAVDALVDFLADFKPMADVTETVDDTISQESQEGMYRQAQLAVANLQSPKGRRASITLEDPCLRDRILENRPLVHDLCTNITDTMLLFPTSMRSATVSEHIPKAVGVELWRASINTLPTIIQKVNGRDWIRRELCLEYNNEQINGLLVSSKYPEFVDSKYGHWLQTYALTRDVNLCNAVSVLVGFGVVAVRVLREPLTSHGLSLMREDFDLHERLNRREHWEKYISYASGEGFRKALVHKYESLGLNCGGLAKFVLAVAVAIQRKNFPYADPTPSVYAKPPPPPRSPQELLMDMRMGFLREMYAQNANVDHAGRWMCELVDVKSHLESRDLTSIFETNLSMEEAVMECNQLPRWCPGGLDFPKTLYKGGEWEFDAEAVDMIFRNLATMAGTSIPPLTPEELMGVFVERFGSSDSRANSTKRIPPATLSQLKEIWLRCDAPHIRVRVPFDTSI